MSGPTIALSLFLVLVAIGIIIVLGFFIVIKRSISRRKSRIGRIVYTAVGNGAPKVWITLLVDIRRLVLERVGKLKN